MATLAEVNKGLADIGIPVAFDRDAALRVSQELGRDKFIDAIEQAKKANANARRWIEVNLQRLGFVGHPENINQVMPSPGDHKSNSPTASEENESCEEREFLSHHVYAKDALCFDTTETRGGFHTIQIEGAKAVQGRKKNWGNKISIQITAGEFPQVARLFLGGNGKVEFSAHGSNNDKGFSIERQGENLFVSLREAKKPVVSVPITPADIPHVASLFIRQWQQNYPWLDAASSVIILLKSSVKPLASGMGI